MCHSWTLQLHMQLKSFLVEEQGLPVLRCWYPAGAEEKVSAAITLT